MKKKKNNFMLTRTSLVAVSGINTSYPDPKNPGRYLDVSELTSSCFLTPDAKDALEKLKLSVQLAGGCLFVTDMFRSWDIQAKAHQAWLNHTKKDFAAPPGESFHMAGRAIDIDLYHLNFLGTKKKDWLRTFWDIAVPIGWRPIVSEPNSALSESWHFEYPGCWLKHYGEWPNKLLAQSAILDCHCWDVTVNPRKLEIMFLQSQINRVGSSPVDIDGMFGVRTRDALQKLNLGNHSASEAITKLVTMC